MCHKTSNLNPPFTYKMNTHNISEMRSYVVNLKGYNDSIYIYVCTYLLTL